MARIQLPEAARVVIEKEIEALQDRISDLQGFLADTPGKVAKAAKAAVKGPGKPKGPMSEEAKAKMRASWAKRKAEKAAAEKAKADEKAAKKAEKAAAKGNGPKAVPAPAPQVMDPELQKILNEVEATEGVGATED